MDAVAISILIALGLALILIEIIFIPGSTLFGILGLILVAGGIIYTFIAFGNNYGFITLALSGLFGLGLFLWGLRSKPWERFSLKGTSPGRVNDEEYFELATGDQGITISSLRPQGKADIKDRIYDVRTDGHYLAADTEIEVTKVRNNIIFVKEVNETKNE